MKDVKELLEEVSEDQLRKSLLIIYDVVKEEFDSKPAAVKHHHIEAGGMNRHVKEVMNIAVLLYDAAPELYQCLRDDVICSAFVHDFNKLGGYQSLPPGDWRRQKKYGGAEFEHTQRLFMNETANTVWICATYGLILSPLVVNAVTFHHGFVSESAKDNVHASAQMSPLSVLLHHADMMSVMAYDRKNIVGEY